MISAIFSGASCSMSSAGGGLHYVMIADQRFFDAIMTEEDERMTRSSQASDPLRARWPPRGVMSPRLPMGVATRLNKAGDD